MRRILGWLIVVVLVVVAVLAMLYVLANVHHTARPALPPLGDATCGGHCGTERWAIKTLSDPDRDEVDLTPVPSSVADLVRMDRPSRLGNERHGPVETTTYRVEARLLQWFREDDGDEHLVLGDPSDTTIQMIAEVPSQLCGGACASGFGAQYAEVRSTLLDHLNATGGEAKPMVIITGVGFFDFRHGQRGLAPNAIELHPVLNVEFPRSPTGSGKAPLSRTTAR